MRGYKYLCSDRDRHGNLRLYFRRHGRKTRINEPFGSDEFFKRYGELLSISGSTPASGSVGAKPLAGTLRWLVVSYLGSSAYRRLNVSTQRTRRRVLEAICLELYPNAGDVYGNCPISRLTTKALRILRDRKQDLPGAASDRVKALRTLFKWAMDEDLIAANPARELSRLSLSSTGFHTWTVEEVRRFEERHQVGTKARLALALLLWTGVRRSDVVLLGRQHARNGWFRFTVTKNRARRPVQVEVPVLPELQRVLEASPTGDLTYLVTEYGRPFTAAGFGNWFRERCREAGVPGSAHGLRKAGAVTAAENGATSQQLMAIFGWLTLEETERYTRAAERRRMAGDGMSKLVRRE